MQSSTIYIVLFGLFISGIAAYIIFPNNITKYMFMATGAAALSYCVYRKINDSYARSKAEPILIKGVWRAKCDENVKTNCGYKKIPRDKLLMSDKEYEYSISFWFRVDGWDYRFGADKVILNNSFLGSSQHTSHSSPRIYLDKHHPILRIDQRVNKPGSSDVNQETYEKITVGSVPIQKWTHFFMVVRNKRVTVFVNGKVVKGHVLKNMPKLFPGDGKKDGSMLVCGDTPSTAGPVTEENPVIKSGFDGVIYSLKYYNRAADYDDISWEYNVNKPSN